MKINAATRLLAAVPLSLVRPAMSGFNRQRYASFFNKYGSGKGADKYRIYIPINSPTIKAEKKTITPPAIDEYLKSKGMAVSDYLVGLAVMPDGKRQIKLGKALADKPDLQKLYNNDPQRATTKSVPGWVVLSRHPYDILGMSFDRGWTSCMNAKSGSNKKFLKADIAQGTIVAYLIKNTDANINSPTARISIKPYVNSKDDIALGAGRTYGSGNATFVQIVNTFCKWFNTDKPAGVYKLEKGLYSDGISRIYVNVDVSKLPETDMVEYAKATTDSDHLHTLASSFRSSVRRAIARNRNAKPEDLALLAKDKNVDVRRGVAENPNTKPETLALLAKDSDQFVIRSVASHPNTSPEILSLLAKDKNVSWHVADNHNTKPEDLALLAKDEDVDVRRAIARNPNTKPEDLALLAKDKSPVVRGTVARSPNTNSETLALLAKDSDWYVRTYVAEHPSTNSETLALLAKDEDAIIREGVAEKHNTSPETLALLAKDVDEEIRGAVAKNPNTNSETLALLAKDKNFDVKKAAMANRNYKH